MSDELRGNILKRRLQVYPSVATFKIIHSIAEINDRPINQVTSKILSAYCETISLSEREMLIKRYDSNSDQS